MRLFAFELALPGTGPRWVWWALQGRSPRTETAPPSSWAQREAAGRAVSPPEPSSEFERFFREHEPEVTSFLWRVTGDPQTACDLSQETFLRAWQHFDRIRTY
jgi:hypothetical protein